MTGTELLTFEDLTPGLSFSFPPRALSRKEIIDFARQWDPQPFHLDEEAARATHFRGLVASGWQTGCLCMRMIAGGRGDAVAQASAAGRPAHPDHHRPRGPSLAEQARPGQRPLRLSAGERRRRDGDDPRLLGPLQAA